MSYDDRPVQKGPLDGMYKDMFWLGIALSVCTCGIGLILSIVGVVTAKDPIAKKNAQICMYISIGLILLGCIIYGVIAVIGIMAGAGGAGGPKF